MRWTDLAFLHWPVSPRLLRAQIPPDLELETYEGQAWIGVVPFRMEHVHPRWVPPIRGLSRFPELNVRTYVRDRDRPGIWFMSLDAGSRAAVVGARLGLNLPYFHADMALRASDSVEYVSRRIHRGARPALFSARYRPTGAVYHARPGTLDHWLTERYCLYGQTRSGRIYSLDIHHDQWPLQKGSAALEQNTMALAADIPLPDEPPLVHFAGRQDVLAWWRQIL